MLTGMIQVVIEVSAGLVVMGILQRPTMQWLLKEMENRTLISVCDNSAVQ